MTDALAVQIVAHALPQWLLALLAAGIVLVLPRRKRRLEPAALLGVGGAGILILGSVVDLALYLVQGRPDPSWNPGLLLPLVWQTTGVTLVAAAVALSVWRGRGRADPAGLVLTGRCVADAEGCDACRSRSLAEVCALLPGAAIVSVSPAFAQLAGRRAEELIGQPLDGLLDLPPASTDVPADGTLPEPDSVNARLRRAAGGPLSVLAAIDFRTSERGTIVSVTVHDGDLLLAAEHEARDAVTLQRGLIELAPTAILVVGEEGVILQANAAAMGLFGLPRQSLVGRSLSAILEGMAAQPVDAERFISRAWRDRAMSLTLTLRRPGYGRYPVELLGRSFWESPRPVLLVFGRSLADERRLQRQLAASHRLTVLGKLFNGTAHDVNNALATILARTQWLEGMSLGQEVKESLRLIERAADDGAHIVRRALDLARGRRRDGVQTVDLSRVMADAAAMCRSRAKEAQTPVRIEQQLAHGAFVRGDESELRELLINLILNALEAMPHGGALRLATRTDADAAEASVADTGCGMDAAVRQRIFEPFFTTKGAHGSGLGLTLVRQIALRHRAAVTVDSEPGKGTTFRVTFRRVSDGPAPPTAERPGDPAARTAAAAPPSPPPHLGRVLVADDDLAIQRVAEDILRHVGHQVRTAGNGRQALAACNRREFDCLLIDLSMPDMDGWQLAAQARQLDPGVALVRLSGWTEPGEPAGNPFDFSLPKPFDLDELLKVVSQSVALSTSRRAGAVPASTKAVDSPAPSQ